MPFAELLADSKPAKVAAGIQNANGAKATVSRGEK